MAKCRSDNTEKQQRNLIPYKPGQSGNPKGRPQGSRNKLNEQFIRDLCKAWETYGQSALMTAAMTTPTEFCNMIARLMPRDVDVTVTHMKADRMSDDQLMEIAMRGKQLDLKANDPDLILDQRDPETKAGEIK
jgi:hypothetical protein